jgi:hypothetical protein
MIVATAIESNSSTLYINNLGLTLLMNNNLGLMRMMRMRNMLVMMIVVVDDPIKFPCHFPVHDKKEISHTQATLTGR